MSETPANWIEDEEWERIQRLIPIACVDILPIRRTAAGLEAGLILRDTPDGRGWCLTGGRLRRNESLRAAVLRQLTSTLGDGVRCSLAERPQPDLIVEYFSEQRPGELRDPRQHALGLTFVLPLSGAIDARGEAIEFRWFPAVALPPASDFGFGQRAVVESLLQRF